MARISNGEFVMKAAAVRRYGVGLMAAINGMRIPAPRFNMGGLVNALSYTLPPLSVPRFADGGMVAVGQGGSSSVTALHPVTLNFGFNQVISGLFAPAAVAVGLQRAALASRSRSNGRIANHGVMS